MKTLRCFSCGGEFPDIDGPVHRYMDSSPGCWATFGEVLAREYSNPKYFEIHRLTVDAYAVQHPGKPSRRSIQSVGIHLIRLCLFHEWELSPENANNAALAAGKYKHNFTWLEPPNSLGPLTVSDIVNAANVEEHKVLVRSWALGAWEAWKPHHEIIRSWLPDQLTRR